MVFSLSRYNVSVRNSSSQGHSQDRKRDLAIECLDVLILNAFLHGDGLSSLIGTHQTLRPCIITLEKHGAHLHLTESAEASHYIT